MTTPAAPARRYSETYRGTGGLAAVGILNQLGRPDMQAAEVLVREALQNCWDAKAVDRDGIDVEIGRVTCTAERLAALNQLLVDPPPELPLHRHLTIGEQMLYIADFGTDGLGGPTRADQPGQPRDYVDFVLNVGQPPDKDLAGGSFGYGKAAFYLASKASTIIIDTLCRTGPVTWERRLIASGLGRNYSSGALEHTGRHWWGTIDNEQPLPLTGAPATDFARALGLPDRADPDRAGTTIVIIAPDLTPDDEPSDPDTAADADPTMRFIAEAVLWNFWPRMVTGRTGVRPSIRVRITDDGHPIHMPDPRHHPRLRGFVEALDRLRTDPDDDTDFIIDRPVRSLRPIRALGRLVIAKGAVGPPPPKNLPLTRGAAATRDGVHHIALLRSPEIIVKYLRCDPPTNPAQGYSGVFKCEVDTDGAFKAAEPPTHDDWVSSAVQTRNDRTTVTVALRRIREIARLAAGTATSAPANSSAVALGEFADTLARFLPGLSGPGARLTTTASTGRGEWTSSPATQPAAGDAATGADDRVPPEPDPVAATEPDGSNDRSGAVPSAPTQATAGPQTRTSGTPAVALDGDGVAVLRYPFELRSNGHHTHLSATVEVMSGDGDRPETAAPEHAEAPSIRSWTDPAGRRHHSDTVSVSAGTGDGDWLLDISRNDLTMIRVNITAIASARSGTATNGATP